MNKERLKEIITQLKDITAELESEVYSDLFKKNKIIQFIVDLN